MCHTKPQKKVFEALWKRSSFGCQREPKQTERARNKNRFALRINPQNLHEFSYSWSSLLQHKMKTSFVAFYQKQRARHVRMCRISWLHFPFFIHRWWLRMSDLKGLGRWGRLGLAQNFGQRQQQRQQTSWASQLVAAAANFQRKEEILAPKCAAESKQNENRRLLVLDLIYCLLGDYRVTRNCTESNSVYKLYMYTYSTNMVKVSFIESLRFKFNVHAITICSKFRLENRFVVLSFSACCPSCSSNMGEVTDGCCCCIFVHLDSHWSRLESITFCSDFPESRTKMQFCKMLSS